MLVINGLLSPLYNQEVKKKVRYTKCLRLMLNTLHFNFSLSGFNPKPQTKLSNSLFIKRDSLRVIYGLKRLGVNII